MGVNEAKNYFFFENFAIHRVKKRSAAVYHNTLHQLALFNILFDQVTDDAEKKPNGDHICIYKYKIYTPMIILVNVSATLY